MKRASFTVEASLIIPLCTIIIIMLIYAVFVMHDRAYAYMEIGEFAEENRILSDDANEIKEMLKKECERHLFVSSIDNIELEYGKVNLIVKAKLKCRAGIFGKCNIKGRYYIADYAKTIRAIEVIKQ